MRGRALGAVVVGLMLVASACGGGSGSEDARGTTVPVTEAPDSAPQGDCAPLDATGLTGGTTLAEGTCHTVTGPLTVAGGTLDIEAGVTISFAESAGLTVVEGGSIVAEGTEDAPVTFTGLDGGAWPGIQLDASSGNVLHNVVISDAGSAPWTGDSESTSALYLGGGTEIDIQDSTIAASAGKALTILDDVDLVLEGSTFRGRGELAAEVVPDVVSALSSTNTFEADGAGGVRIGLGTDFAVTAEQTWQAGIPFEIQGRVTVEAPLTLEPGARIAFGADASMEVVEGGSLNAEGTEDDPITLTGIEELPGHWKGLRVATAAVDNVFDHVTFENGGSEVWTGAPDSTGMVYLEGNSKVVVTNSTFRGSGGYGMSVPVDGDIEGFDANTFTENARAMYVHPERAGQIAATNTFEDNDEDRVRVAASNTDFLRTAQTWQDIGVPFYVTTRVRVAAVLTVAAGTVVEFAQDASLEVPATEGGALRSAGTAESPVTFRGGEDVEGYWKGISIGTASNDNLLEHTVLRNGGSDDWYGGGDAAASFYMDAGTAALTNVTFEAGAGHAIIVAGDAALTCTNVDLGGLTHRTGGVGGTDHAACPA